jgi:hypothetical protein
MRARMPSASTPRRAPVTLVALTSLACTGLTACASNDPPTEVVVTVTGAPTPAASAAPRPSAPPQPEAARPDSEVRGRTFDFGLVTGARTVGATDVLVVDRWTDPRVPDDTLAERGLEVAPWDLGSDRYVNQNSDVTFDIPVREGTTFLLHHCVAKGEPVQTRSAGAAALGDAPESDRLLLVEIDDEGWATGGETLAGC